ncbi:hypothetical protein CYLTODRAFT_471148 [Cylindrobasidium torrendii FP15055 ss-10]|uniref:Uncharacterized protein n=1 Tax=Cylindrobasidium torrendii FP15055 ss-10 TaxID=1314674 RepID=A0A0D7BL51_9AGAR|nr:hypothetical protein CYLTODRAFT_471148 [Cylindrobasidium torrendii FP15055 ss-10]
MSLTTTPRLPVEILTTIFELVVYGGDSDSTSTFFQIGGPLPSQFLLMAVCKHWKKICASLPRLWENTTLSVISKVHVLRRGAPVWDQFAQACEKALKGRHGPLRLEIVDWHISDCSFEINRLVKVTDHRSLANRVLALALDESPRWQTFTMCGWKPILPQHVGPCIPLLALLDVKSRLSRLQDFAFFDLYRWMPQLLEPPPECADIFLSAPRLSSAIFNAGIIPFNLPWAQLTQVVLDASSFGTYRKFAGYFDLVMRHTTATTVMWHSPSYFIDGDDTFHNILPIVTNSHVVDLRVQALILPPLRLPNLTRLRFIITDVRDGIQGSASCILSLLANSGCRLADLTIDQLPQYYKGSIASFAPFVPYLDTLHTLVWNAPLVNDAVLDNLIDGLRDILTEPTKLPSLSTLEVNISESRYGYVQYCYFDSQHADAVWDIVRTRMIGQGRRRLSKFHINVECDQDDPMVVSVDVFKSSPAGKNILAAGVDFKLEEPVGVCVVS